jgi:aspartate racemase
MSGRGKVVGVLGGMGPAATLDFFARVLALTPAAKDQEHIRLIIDNNAQVPNRNAAIAGTGPSPAPVLAEMARGLKRAGAELLVMPCNAAHAFLDAIVQASDLPVISIIDVTVAETLRRGAGVKHIGLLAADGCINAGLYQRAFAAHGAEVLLPDAALRARFMDTLTRIKQGEVGDAVRADMRAIAAQLVAAGAEAIVAGCTEVPLVLSDGDIAVPLISSTDCLAVATIAAARDQIA